MPTFKKDDGTVGDMIASLQHEFECYEEQIEARVKIDVVMAFADRDEDGERLNDALSHHGVKALGIARNIGKKDRAMGRGDAEIALDGDWWECHNEEERLALLDHEIYHIVPKRDRDGNFKIDDMRRPLIRMRPHDEEFGWFRVIAARHGAASQEQQQAAQMMDEASQFYWPDLLGETPPMEKPAKTARGAVQEMVRSMEKAAGPGGSVTISGDGFSHTITGK